MAEWQFRLKAPGEKERNPVSAEYFDEESIERPAQALVREAIQNSLDARAKTSKQVRVRFFVSGARLALDSDEARRWFGEVWPHLRAADSGLRGVTPSPGRCRFLVVEDFGTKGLEGDENAYELSPGAAKNHFFAFFRAEGVSENTGGRGKWGVGKTVFPRASRINALFGLTIRENDSRPLLMGQAILRYHSLDDQRFAPDLMFGASGVRGVTLPFNSVSIIEEFQSAFGISREDETGLSVVVPYVNQEISRVAIANAIAREYFYPILLNKLVVEIGGDDQGNISRFDQDTLLESIEDDPNIDRDLGEVIKLAVWAETLPDGDIVPMSIQDGAAQVEFAPESISNESLQLLKGRFEAGDPLAIRIPVSVREQSGPARTSHFDVYLRQDLEGRGYAPVFIRDGITIPKAVERRIRGHNVFVLVIIDEGALSEFLANAETPAHTHWSHQTENFRDRYIDGRALIDFVKSAPRRLIELLMEEAADRDAFALAEFFPRTDPANDRPAKRKKVVAKPGQEPEVPEPPDDRGERTYEIEPRQGGFTVRANSKDGVGAFEVKVAYSNGFGDAFSKYDPLDFDFAQEQIDIAPTNADIVSATRNLIVFESKGPKCSIACTGFDPIRDLVVSVTDRA